MSLAFTSSGNESPYTTALAMFPIIVISKMRLRPYLSDNAPI
jgi:hypothetical protein